jgi:hypothetical protein
MNDKVVKWIVLGIIGLAFLLIFNRQIGELINRISLIDVKGKVRVVATPIGETTVSVQKSSENVDATKLGSNIYVDKHYKFAISWPVNSGWIPGNKKSKDQLAALGFGGPLENYGTFFVVKPKTSLSLNAGMVNVYAYPKQFDNIQETIDAYIRTIRNRGSTILSSSIDKYTGGAVLVTSDGTVSGVTRIVLGDTYVYTILMASVPSSNNSEEEYAKLRNDINMIFNSFRILN